MAKGNTAKTIGELIDKNNLKKIFCLKEKQFIKFILKNTLETKIIVCNFVGINFRTKLLYVLFFDQSILFFTSRYVVENYSHFEVKIKENKLITISQIKSQNRLNAQIGLWSFYLMQIYITIIRSFSKQKKVFFFQ